MFILSQKSDAVLIVYLPMENDSFLSSFCLWSNKHLKLQPVCLSTKNKMCKRLQRVIVGKM